MAWRVRVRNGPKVERHEAHSLQDALDALEAACRGIAEGPGRRPVDLRYKRFEPVQQVQARGEVSGPGRLFTAVHGGIDVRGDGSVEAFVGRARKRLVEQQPGESAYDALRRALSAQSSVSVEP